ncbi:MAG: YHS domain-containing protein [Thermoproteota archaeon]
MEVDESKTQWKTTYEGKTYYFCSEDCLKSSKIIHKSM